MSIGDFTIDTKLDPIAILALVLSCLALLMQLWQMRKRRLKLRVDAYGFAQFADFARDEDEFWCTVFVEVFNVGGVTVTIRRLEIVEFASPIDKFLNKGKRRGSASETRSNSFLLAPGESKKWGIPATDVWSDRVLREISVVLWHSHSTRPIRARVRLPQLPNADDFYGRREPNECIVV